MTTTVPMYLYILYLYCVFSIVILKPKLRATPRKGCVTDNDDSKKPNTDYSAARNSSNDHAPKHIPARVKPYSFLKSLSQTLSRDLCDPAALRYI